MYAPSVLEVVIRPELYEGQPLRLVGYYSDAPQDSFLYPTAEAYEYGEQPSALPIHLEQSERHNYHRFDGKRVLLEATLKRGVIRSIRSIYAHSLRRSTTPLINPPPPGVRWPKEPSTAPERR